MTGLNKTIYKDSSTNNSLGFSHLYSEHLLITLSLNYHAFSDLIDFMTYDSIIYANCTL